MQPSSLATAPDFPVRPPAPVKGWRPSTVAVAMLLVYFGIIEVEGALRWVLGLVHLEPLLYARDLLPLAGTALLLRSPGNGPRNLLIVAFLGQLLFASVISLLYGSRFAQVIVGLKVFLPLIFGIAIYPAIFKNWRFFGRGCLVLLVIGAVGVVLNSRFSFPWIGTDFTAFNVTVEVSRDWTEVGGRERLPGFSRASYDTATQTVFFAIVGLYFVRRFTLRLLVAAISIYTVYLTTSKVALACLIQVVVNFLVLECIPFLRDAPPGSSAFRVKQLTTLVLRLQILLFALATVVLPLDTNGTLNILERDLREDSQFHLLSMQDRAVRFWPLAFEYIKAHGSSLFGVGVGGIGTPLELFGKFDTPITADNGFIYAYGILGWVVAIYIALFLWVVFTRRLIHPTGTTFFGMLALSACVQAVSKNTFEGLYDCVFIGLILSHVAFGWRTVRSLAPPRRAAPPGSRPPPAWAPSTVSAA